MKKNIFNTLIKRYPELRTLSARRFSLLTRKELYWIIQMMKNDEDVSQEVLRAYLKNYTRISNKELSSKLYNWFMR